MANNMKIKKILSNTYPYREFDDDKRWHQRGRWPCNWISGAGNLKAPFGIAYQLQFTLDSTESFQIHLSADERYEFFVDGQRIARGPERGAPEYWYFETYELSLEKGNHNFVALVWTMGHDLAPYAQMSVGHGFLLGAEGKMHEKLSTGVAPWRSAQIQGVSFRKSPSPTCIGPEFEIDGKSFSWGIEKGFEKTGETLEINEPGATPSRINEYKNCRLLVPASLPDQLFQKINGLKVRYVSDCLTGKVDFSKSLDDEIPSWERLLNGETLSLAPNEKRRIIIDMDDYYCGYPELILSGGAASLIEVSWAEAMFTEDSYRAPKKCRDDIANRFFKGIKDSFRPDGGEKRKFTIPWWRSGRFIEITVTVGEEALSIESLGFFETRYPLESESVFETANENLEKIASLSLRTMQMCLHETYMDCPYYEQLMYVGDTRLQILAGYVVSNDKRPAKKAIELIKSSILANGLTQSRYPSKARQIIPPFSLWWIAMVYDYALWRGELDFIKKMTPWVKLILDSVGSYANANGFIEALPGWNFSDWAPEWRTKDQGVPTNGEFGVSGVINWHYVYTLNLASKLFEITGDNSLAVYYRHKGQSVAEKLVNQFYDKERHLLADTLDGKVFSEHSQCLAILSGMLPDNLKDEISEALLTDSDMIQTTVYFSHYLFETYFELGAEKAFFEKLELWKSFDNLNLKTYIEEPEPSRSDCHAWSSHPLYHFFATLAGIRPTAPGFSKIKIKPMCETIQSLNLKMPTPKGEIQLKWKRNSDQVTELDLTIPENMDYDTNLDRGQLAEKNFKHIINVKKA